MFIKHGDGKIMTVIEEGELTDTQKKASKELSKQMVKQSDQDTDASIEKKSGR
jgi:hypothetical protein